MSVVAEALRVIMLKHEKSNVTESNSLVTERFLRIKGSQSYDEAVRRTAKADYKKGGHHHDIWTEIKRGKTESSVITGGAGAEDQRIQECHSKVGDG